MSPSKAHRFLACPGSMLIEHEDLPSEWAATGTKKHAVLTLLLEGKAPLAGDTVQTEAGPYEVPLLVLEQCQEIKEFIDQFRATNPHWVVETETKVEIGSHVWKLPRGLCAGTADVAAYSFDGELLVLDAKFGFVQVQADNNPQLMLYALGLLAEIPATIERVTLCIAQPGFDGEVIFREWRTTATHLYEWAAEVWPIIAEILAGSRRLQADDHACHYCPGRIQCPARMEAMDKALATDWMEGRDLAELLTAVPRLEAICKDIKQAAVSKLATGSPVHGFKLVAAKSRRKWTDEAAKETRDHLNRYLPSNEMFKPLELKSPAQMEKAVRAYSLKGGIKMTVKEAKEVIEVVAFQPAGKPKLAPESDPRPALQLTDEWTLEDIMQATLESGNEE
jgi:hypothetical protein